MNLYQRFPLKDHHARFTLAVAYPHDIESLLTVKEALHRGIISKALLCGDEAIILEKAKEAKLSKNTFEIIHCPSMEEAADQVARLAFEKKAHALMKGLLDTSIFLKPLLKKEYDLKKESLLSHAMLLYREKDDRFYLVSDGGMVIAPTLEQKKTILHNTVELAHAMGLSNPVAVPLTAKEKPYEKMPATMDAESLRLMNVAGEIKGCRVSGPMQFDVAVSKESATKKGVKDPLAGQAEILLCPCIEVGNVLVKSLTYLADFVNFGLVLGAKIPIIVVSRSDGEEEKLGSIYLARLLTEKE